MMIYNAHDTRECHWTMNSIYVFDHSCGKASSHQIYGWYILINGYTNHPQFISIFMVGISIAPLIPRSSSQEVQSRKDWRSVLVRSGSSSYEMACRSWANGNSDRFDISFCWIYRCIILKYKFLFHLVLYLWFFYGLVCFFLHLY